MPTCNVCGNHTNFMVTGSEVRRTDVEPENTVFHFVVTKAVCTNTNCADYPSTNVTLDPVPAELVPYIALLTGG